MRFSAGDKLGHYDITELIGKGGMGEVYRGVDTRLGRSIIVQGSKVVPSGPVIQISANGGFLPKWGSDGKELFFATNDGSIMANGIDAAKGGFRPSAPMPLGAIVPLNGFAPSRSGQRFLVISSPDQGVKTPITVVTNWEATLKRQ